MNATAIVERMTPQDAQILAEYGAGTTMRTIAKKLAISLDDVTEVVRDLASTNRGTATALALAWQETPKAKAWKAEQAKVAEETVVAALDKPAPAPKPKPAKPETVALSTPDKPPAVPELVDTRECFHGPECSGSGPECAPIEVEDALLAAREGHQAALAEMDEMREQRDAAREALRRLDEAAGRDIGKENEPLLDRIADLKRGREEATERALELAKRVAELESLPRPENPIDDARDTGDPALLDLADNIRGQLAGLRVRVGQWRAEAPLREELARIEARAAEIRTQLGATS
ncbi:hypothetical protein AB0M54_24470 [Actinoplanes sp. NPDC051470]|uniref:hypothetical protein n=1 Tax=Actinoplanes sp. NPDC051470 TaxID=3157224 RepID=UPI00342CC341